MFRQMYLDWGRQKMGLDFAETILEDDVVEIMKERIANSNIAQRFLYRTFSRPRRCQD